MPDADGRRRASSVRARVARLVCADVEQLDREIETIAAYLHGEQVRQDRGGGAP